MLQRTEAGVGQKPGCVKQAHQVVDAVNHVNPKMGQISSNWSAKQASDAEHILS